MQYISHYHSPLGGLMLAADEEGLIGVWFDGEKYFADVLEAGCEEKETDDLQMARRWLDIYFSGKDPEFLPRLHLIGTGFQKEVWGALLHIPYGRTKTYGEIAGEIARRHQKKKMSAQAVGGAVGHNHISLIVPCHRVVGTGGSLTGYAGGIRKKEELLKLEHVDMAKFFIPKKGAAL